MIHHIIRGILTALLIALAWHSGEIGPWTSLILALITLAIEAINITVKSLIKSINLITYG